VAELFNEYAQKNNIDIRMIPTVYTPENSTSNVNDFWSSVYTILENKSTKYDIIFYDVIYSPRYSPFLLDLNDWLPEKHLDLYSGKAATEVGKFKGKWVGLVSVNYKSIKLNYM